MNGRLFGYIFMGYFKSFLLTFSALMVFFVGMDFILNYQYLPASANLQVLYLFYNGLSISNYLLSTALVFAFVVVILNLIKSNAITSFYTFGYSKRDILAPMIAMSMMMIVLSLLVNSTDLAYSKERAFKIMKGSVFSDTRLDLFIKYHNTFVYIGEFSPSQNAAHNVKVYEMEKDEIRRIIEGKDAFYRDGHWVIQDATITTKPQKLQLNAKGLEIVRVEQFNTLEGFKPKLIDSIYEDNSISFALSLGDAISTLMLLAPQNIDTSKIRLVLYQIMVMPLFAPMLIVIMFYYSPISGRIANLTYFASLNIFITLLTWGAMFVMSKLAFGSFLTPEIAIILPILTLFAFASYLYSRL